LSSLFGGIWAAGLVWSYGKRFQRWLGITAPNIGLDTCLAIGLGVLLFNLFWMGLGLVGLWYGPLWLAGLLSLSIPLVMDLWERRRERPSFRPQEIHWIALPFVALYGLFLLLHSVLPETFYDSLNYFWGMPDFWMSRHGIVDYPTHLLSGYFHGGSLFFMTAFAFGGVPGAKVLGAVVWMLCGLFAYGWTKEIAGPSAAVMAGVATLTFPLLYMNAWNIRVDALLTLVLLLFLYVLDQAGRRVRRKGSYNWAFLAALFAGLALSIKPTAIVGIVAGLIVVLVQRGWGLLKDGKLWVLFGSAGLLEVGPWLLKNAAFTGNPFFPYAIHSMGGRQFPQFSYERLLGENRQFLPMEHGLRSILDLPWRLTMPQAGDGQFIGPILLAFLPLLLFVKMKDASLKFMTGAMVLSLVTGLTLSHMLRFSIPAFVLGLMVLSAILVAQKGTWLRGSWAGAVLGLAVLLAPVYADLSVKHYDGAGYWSGHETAAAYLGREIGNSYEPLVEWTDEKLGRDVRLLLVGDARGVYYQREHYANSVFDEQFFAQAAREEKDAAGILQRLKRMGITHVVINGPEGLRVSKGYRQYEMTPAEWARLNAFASLGLKPLYWKDFQAVYEVRSRLTVEKLPEVPNLFSFFAPSAYDFFQAQRAGDIPKAREALRTQSSLFPMERFWKEKAKTLGRS
jgi:4-amino-4-deoxy-L-arabinose transferase-like glycosyltransferase